MTKVINLLGGPGTGKSATAGKLFGYLKSRNIICEYVSEFAKELILTESKDVRDQFYVAAMQAHRIHVLNNKVDFIVTDSAIIQAIPYLFEPDRNIGVSLDIKRQYARFLVDYFNTFDNLNWLVERTPDSFYETFGREQTLEQSLKKDQETKELLLQYNIEYYVTDTVHCFDCVVDKIERMSQKAA